MFMHIERLLRCENIAKIDDNSRAMFTEKIEGKKKKI